jgi:hypothetical protein
MNFTLIAVREFFGWILISVVGAAIFMLAVLAVCPDAQAQIMNYGLPLHQRPPSTRPYKVYPSKPTYKELQDNSVTIRRQGDRVYGNAYGQDFSARQYGNTTLIEAGDRSVTCQTANGVTWCQ